MKAMPNDDFAKAVLSMGKAKARAKGIAHYEKDGACIEFFASSEPFYAERVDELVTVYYSQETKKIIGSQIKGVSTFVRAMVDKFPGFGIEIRDGRIKLRHLFRAKLWSGKGDPNDVTVLQYQKLIEVAEESDVETDLCAN